MNYEEGAKFLAFIMAAMEALLSGIQLEADIGNCVFSLQD